MREFKKRRTVGAEILRITVGLVGVALLCLGAFFAARGAWDMYGKFAGAATARAQAEAQLQDLQARHQKIATEVSELESPRGLEAELRERYGVARPGEGEIQIVRQASSTEILRQEPNVFEKLWRSLLVW